MTDRDLIAQAIFDALPSLTLDSDTDRLSYDPFDTMPLADAVLAALDGRIIPALPDNWWSIELIKSDGGIMRVDEPAIPEGHVYANMWDDSADPDILSGTGPTLAAAIADALEDGHE